MSIHNINILHIRPAIAALLACVLTASCSEEDPGEGSQLPEGKYPFTFTASVGELKSRAAAHEQWDEGDEVGVQIGNYRKIGRYKLNADGNVMSSVTPLDWQTLDPTTVTAWFPFEDQNEVSLVDQSKGFKTLDFLTAVAEDQRYDKSVALEFRHQMAKISCTVLQGDGLSDEEFSSVEVHFHGYSTASFSKGILTHSDEVQTIKPLTDPEENDYEALMVPREMTGQLLISISLKVNVNGQSGDKAIYSNKILTYTPKDASDDLVAGQHRHYEVTVRKDELVVNPVKGEWKDDRDPGDANLNIFRVKMTKGYPKDRLHFSEGVTLITDVKGDYLEVTGNDFIMTFDETDAGGKCQVEFKGFDRDVMETVIEKDKNGNILNTYYKFHLRSGEITTLTCSILNLSIGDYYYFDGTYSPAYVYDPENPCIGIVFYVGIGTQDSVDNYTKGEKQLLESINGYVIALKDTPAAVTWSKTQTNLGSQFTVSTSAAALARTIFNGYSTYNGEMATTVYTNNSANFAAINAVRDFDVKISDQAENCSGWYLPSSGQLWWLANGTDGTDAAYKKILAKLEADKAAGRPIPDFNELQEASYWSCTQSGAQNVYYVDFKTPGTGPKSGAKNPKVTEYKYVRPILTF